MPNELLDQISPTEREKELIAQYNKALETVAHIAKERDALYGDIADSNQKRDQAQLRLKEAEEEHDKEISEFQSITELLTIRLKEAEWLIRNMPMGYFMESARAEHRQRRLAFLATTNTGGKPLICPRCGHGSYLNHAHVCH